MSGWAMGGGAELGGVLQAPGLPTAVTQKDNLRVAERDTNS